ncbi:DegT/DnrJ/EryC1/StrS family aminotransferase [Parvicella tangerina]|uniref:UDP-4-amino-4-deoxy-L-arabinose--oxoglutarate aminotransferase n=1 Tax=Parvicella tangerina TaxID=2829795 RepID=A0A916JKC5_9FLAO|nr:DegT/DnrJ/EryC1/StrS family aminotransferase [Parvicella tangerina]CAG5078060.1 UDP-4-amino-4-deoxy-L-arabinose--oxoglutarate aminotransferase [Parvicella tangerina]
MIPFSPPRIDDKTIASVTEALKSGWISTGPKTRLFEQQLATYLGTDEVVCLNSATAGLQLILHWLGIGEGDEVIVPAYTYTASVNVIVHTGATPVLVDVRREDFNIDPEKVREAITEKTKAIIAVDIGGFPADYNELFGIVNNNAIKAKFKPGTDVQSAIGRIMVIADAAHSIGARYHDDYTGKQADMSSFSFHAVKNLTTAEGGAVVFNVSQWFNHSELKSKFKTSSLHGQNKDAFSKVQIGGWRYDVLEAGFKCNMTDLQAAIGLVELERYEDTLQRRRDIFRNYSEALSSYEWAIIPNYISKYKCTSYHLYMLRIKGINETTRDKIIDEIGKNGVAVNVHYIPIPMLTFYKNLGYRIADYPVCYELFQNEISLPVYYNLTDEQVQTVVTTLVNAVNNVLNE